MKLQISGFRGEYRCQGVISLSLFCTDFRDCDGIIYNGVIYNSLSVLLQVLDEKKKSSSNDMTDQEKRIKVCLSV
jgi:hypothetical protein